ncbi:hypothetical protein [Longimicrobium sp.]|uniref:hypothetical protein n=1 Tax=Longimicrobium sp. TaxID=2029185 RepID=UPI003B3BDCC2
MSRSIEVSDEDYARLEEVAAADGVAPAEWIARSIAACTKEPHPCSNGKPARSMADVLAGRVGLFDSGGDGMLSERHSELFGDYLAEKRKAGRL